MRGAGGGLGLMLTFDALTHTYTLDGRELPSVTTILKGTGMIDYSMIPQAVLQEAGRRGTAVHVALQYMDDGELDESSVAPEYAGYIKAAKRFYAETGFTVAHNEYRDYHRGLLYAGTLDRTGVFPDDSLAVVDWKTGLVMPAHALQLVGYANFFRNPRRYRRIAVKLNADGTYRAQEFPAARFEQDWAMFQAALACYQWQRLNETGKAA
jgi:hypothetical protein